MESANKTDTLTYFTCKHPTGVIRPLKKIKITFYFIPQEMGNFEELYIFSLGDNHYTEPILLAGGCREPLVLFTHAHARMNPTVLGEESTFEIMLRNKETIPLTFSFMPESLFCWKHEHHLEVIPMTGTIQPTSNEKLV